jgi:hypothetical protein
MPVRHPGPERPRGVRASLYAGATTEADFAERDSSDAAGRDQLRGRRTHNTVTRLLAGLSQIRELESRLHCHSHADFFDGSFLGEAASPSRHCDCSARATGGPSYP